jgi:phosphatidylglycerol:prolipoprotein diacylglycerol transferase
MIYSMIFPAFDPVLIQLGPVVIRWYALAYITSLVLGWRIVRHLVRLDPPVATAEQVDDFLTWATLGVVFGGRLGYVLFYQPGFYLSHPLQALFVWQGGMSFHGGMLGVTAALILFCWRRGLPLFGFADRVATIVPLGLGLGRIANFINGELWGREAPDWLPWAMAFPNAGPELRHPSQLYQASMEGVLLLCVTAFLCSRPAVRARFGTITGAFLVGYGIARIIGEYFREPDRFLGYLWEGITMGQLLSLPMIAAGLVLIVWAKPRSAVQQTA